MKAVVIFNLGGPDHLKNVEPFLFNLFYDKAIINLPNPARYLLAKFVSKRRNRTAQEIYKHLGGKSPILEETEKQACALQSRLGEGYKVYIAMRYWKPMISEVLDQILSDGPDEIILLPLYPQFSTTTTGSFFNAWEKECVRKKVQIPTRRICCYPNQPDYVLGIVDTIKQSEIPSGNRFLFSAHGLPQKCIDAGDPYEKHVTTTVNSVLLNMPEIKDAVICYQSKVGPLKWLGPSTESELARAARDKVPVAIVPISFVSENSETLYELDYQYKLETEGTGLPGYYRVPTVGQNANYINALGTLVESTSCRSCAMINCQIYSTFWKAA